MTGKTPVRVVVADGREIIRRGLGAIISARSDLRLVGEAEDGSETLQLCEMLEPEVIILAAGLLEKGSASLIHSISARWPAIHLLVLDGPGESDLVEAALGAGAGCCLSTAMSAAEVVEAIQRAVQGGQPLLAESARAILSAEHLGQLEDDLRSDPLDMDDLSRALAQHLPFIFPQWQIQVRLYQHHNLFVHPEHHFQPLPDPAWKWVRSQERAASFSPGDAHPWGGEQHAPGSLILAPLPAAPGGQPPGGMALLHPGTPEDLDELLPILQSVGLLLSAGLKKAQVQEGRFFQQTTVQELRMAGRIQAGILPEKAPDIRGWDIATRLIPARETSGDFYDFIPLAKDTWGIVTADVTDKGLGAAVFMALSSTLLRTYAVQYQTLPAFAMASVNERILSDTRGSMFVTAFYGVLEPETGRLRYVNAGHNPPFVLSTQKGKPVDRLFRTGMALGILKEASWQQKIVKLNPGDVLLLYTDGITEAQNRHGALFGEKRLLEVIRPLIGRPARDIVETVINEVESFSDKTAAQDDITLLVLARKS